MAVPRTKCGFHSASGFSLEFSSSCDREVHGLVVRSLEAHPNHLQHPRARKDRVCVLFLPFACIFLGGGLDKMELISAVLLSFAIHKGHSELHFPRCASSEPSAPAQALQSGGLERGAGALSNCSSSLFRPRWSQLFCLTKQNGAVALSFLLSWASG